MVAACLNKIVYPPKTVIENMASAIFESLALNARSKKGKRLVCQDAARAALGTLRDLPMEPFFHMLFLEKDNPDFRFDDLLNAFVDKVLEDKS